MNGNNEIYLYFSFIPILALIIISLKYGVKTAALFTFIITTVLYFFWGSPINYFFAAMVSSFVSTINILIIVAGAILLYSIMNKAGLVDEISSSINSIHPSVEIRFFLIAISLTAFFEGVAGFGTPGAIVPLLLITQGFSPVFSVSAVLIFNGLFAIFGAVGTPLIAGLQQPLNLTVKEVSSIGIYSAVQIAVAGYLILWFVCGLYEKLHAKMENKNKIFLLYTFFALPFIILSFFAGELTTILAAVIMVILSIIYLNKDGRKINLTPWIPYGGLILLLLLPKIIHPLAEIISIPVSFDNIFSSKISAVIRPLASPLIPFIIVSAGIILYKKNIKPDGKDLFRKIFSVFIILFPAIAVSQMMLHSGFERLSMVEYIANIFSTTGIAYIVFAPLIGITGAFITGSTTVSNIIFGPSQMETSQLLFLNKEIILSLQLSGASIGNAISLFNIVAAAAVVGLTSYKEVLRSNLLPAILSGIFIGLLILVFYIFF